MWIAPPTWNWRTGGGGFGCRRDPLARGARAALAYAFAVAGADRRAGDPALRFEVPVLLDTGGHEPRSGLPNDAEQTASAPAPQAVAIPASSGEDVVLRRLGWVDIPFAGGTRRLALSWMEGNGGGLYLPCGDATNGDET
jgi:hypothetical protein